MRLDTLPKPLKYSVKVGRTWEKIIAEECCANLPEHPLPKAAFTVIRHADKFLDYETLVLSMRPVVRALVSVGVIVDDSWSVLGSWNVGQKYRSKKDGPLLEILLVSRPDKFN